jgi:membrane dipeptidase
VFRTTPNRELLFGQIALYHSLSIEHSIPIVRGSGDISRDGLNFLLALEGTDTLVKPEDVFLLKELGVRSIGITWNYDTKFGASCRSRHDYGLTGFGQDLVKICNDSGVVVDLAHSSRKTILDVCRISSRPVIFSHGNASSVHRNVRNIDDDCIEAVASTGGIIGITAIPPTLGENAKIEDMVRHATYIGERFGWDHVGIGTDFLGIDSTPIGFEDITKIWDLQGLLGNNAEKVMWKNGDRVLRKVLL